MNVEQRIEVVREICAFEGRLAGTDAERRAAADIARRLEGLGRQTEIEPTYVHPQWPLVQALHCLLALAGSLAALEYPPIGFAIVLLSALSMYLDLNARFYLLRRLFFRRASQNVVSRGRGSGRGGTLVLCANYDAGRSGSAYGRGWCGAGARVARLFPAPFSPARLVFWSVAVLLPLIGLRMAGVEDNWISILQLPPTLVRVVAIFLLIDIQLSPVAAGANANASGVATVLALTEELAEEPPAELDIWVVLGGAGGALNTGMREFVRSHRDELDRESTWFLSLDAVGEGAVRFEVSQGPIVSYGMASRLTELGAAIAEADAERDEPAASPLKSGYASGSLSAVLARYPATTITCLPPGAATPPRANTLADTPGELDPDSLERAHRFALELVRALDRDLTRRAQREAAVV
ncbi:MAG: M28 family peptidase [Solirubrobacterales bacterium]